MFTVAGWDNQIAPTDNAGDGVGLESFNGELTQGTGNTKSPPSFFKPINVVAEGGRFYATVYVCELFDGTDPMQALAVWLSSLKETDKVTLVIASMMVNPPLSLLVHVMAALASTPAHLTIRLDTVVVDNLAYFYLVGDTVVRGTEGSVFIPSYVDQRSEDTSAPWKAVHDFYSWVIGAAVIKKILTTDEAEALNRGLPVVVPDDRFS